MDGFLQAALTVAASCAGAYVSVQVVLSKSITKLSDDVNDLCDAVEKLEGEIKKVYEEHVTFRYRIHELESREDQVIFYLNSQGAKIAPREGTKG